MNNESKGNNVLNEEWINESNPKQIENNYLKIKNENSESKQKIENLIKENQKVIFLVIINF